MSLSDEPTRWLTFGSATVYPEHNWNALMFDRVPNRCWADPLVQKQFFETVKVTLGIETEGLLAVPTKEFCRLGGTGLMKANKSRKYDVILAGKTELTVSYSHISPPWTVYPELNSQASVAQQDPEYWKDLERTKGLLERIQGQLKISSPQDWDKVSIRCFTELGGGPMLRSFGSLRAVLSAGTC